MTVVPQVVDRVGYLSADLSNIRGLLSVLNTTLGSTDPALVPSNVTLALQQVITLDVVPSLLVVQGSLGAGTADIQSLVTDRLTRVTSVTLEPTQVYDSYRWKVGSSRLSCPALPPPLRFYYISHTMGPYWV